MASTVMDLVSVVASTDKKLDLRLYFSSGHEWVHG
jgi:hypothetical protein